MLKKLEELSKTQSCIKQVLLSVPNHPRMLFAFSSHLLRPWQLPPTGVLSLLAYFLTSAHVIRYTFLGFPVLCFFLPLLQRGPCLSLLGQQCTPCCWEDPAHTVFLMLSSCRSGNNHWAAQPALRTALQTRNPTTQHSLPPGSHLRMAMQGSQRQQPTVTLCDSNSLHLIALAKYNSSEMDLGWKAKQRKKKKG